MTMSEKCSNNNNNCDTSLTSCRIDGGKKYYDFGGGFNNLLR